MTSKLSPVSALIIGAGPAGLSCSVALSRLLHTSIVFSSNKFRNDLARHMHTIPTWEHRSPAEFRDAFRKDILKHYDTVTFQDVGVNKVEKIENGSADGSMLFRAVDETGREWWGRRVVLATGVKDLMLDIEGYESCWVKGIFHCLFCHGFEERGAASAGILAIADCAPGLVALYLARFAVRLAEKVTIYTNGDEVVTKGVNEALSKANPESKTRKLVSIDNRKIARLVKGPDEAEVEVVFEDGSKQTEGFLVHKPSAEVNGPWVDQLGLETTPKGDIKVNGPFGETSVAGVFAGGDCAVEMKTASIALSSGGAVGAGLAMSLGAED